MSIDYVMYLADDRRPNEVIDDLDRELASGGRKENGAPAPNETLPHLWIAATEVAPPIDAFVYQDHGFAPRIRVHLRLDKEHLDSAQRELLDVVTLLLRRSTEDAVLLRNEETVALRRHGGTLELKDDALWFNPVFKERVERLKRHRGTTIV